MQEHKNHGQQHKHRWRQHSSAVRSSLNLPRTSMPWSEAGAALRGIGNSERKIDLVNVAWGARVQELGQRKSVQEMATNFWIDLGFSISRRPWSQKLRAIHKNSQLYSYQYDRCLTGDDCMQINGWPQGYVRGIPQTDLLSMAADGTSLPMVSVLQFVVWSNPFSDWHVTSSTA